jgi:hypothetical protein
MSIEWEGDMMDYLKKKLQPTTPPRLEAAAEMLFYALDTEGLLTGAWKDLFYGALPDHVQNALRRAVISTMKASSEASETAPPTDVDELIAELKSALEELRIAGATPKCQRCEYPHCFCKDVPASTTAKVK